MTLLFTEGFDYYDKTEFLEFTKWDQAYQYSSPGWGISTTLGRRGTGALYMNGPAFNDYLWVSNYLSTSSQTLIGGVAVNKENHIGGFYIAIYDDDTQQFRVEIPENNGNLRFVGAGVELDSTATGWWPIGSYHYLEYKVTIDNSSGSFEVKVDGETILSDTGVDTQASANSSGNRLMVYFINDSLTLVDDLYVCNSLGSTNNDFLGDCKVETILPSGAGANTNWTPSAGSNYECVDDVPANDDTDYVSTSSTGSIDTYDFPNLSSSSGTVYGICQYLHARKADAGSRTLKSVIRSGGTNYPNSNNHSIGDNYAEYFDIVEQDPDTSSAWTISGVNAAEFGVELEA